MAGTKRRSTRQAATRKRSIYIDPETDDDFEADVDDVREQRRPQEPMAPLQKKRKVSGVRHKPQTRSKSSTKQTRSVRSVFKIGKPRKVNSKAIPAHKKGFTGPSDNKIPSWTSLPVDILRDIFVFASRPLNEYNSTESFSNITWLLRAARTCRAFSLPALEAYYQSPALLTSLQPHNLLDLLRTPNDSRYIDYNVKVHTLELHVRTLAYVAHSKPLFDIAALVTELPRLQHMEIVHPKYQPPYRYHKLQRWTFASSQLFDVMDEHQILLKSWRWSRDLIPKNAFLDLYGSMTQAHTRRVFSRLQRLVVCGFNYEDSSEPVIEDGFGALADGDVLASLPGLATSISKLPALKDLTFISCDIIMNKFLSRLPTNLQRLELSNCLEITSDMMRAFFKTSASDLRELVLNHNAALSLGFLTELRLSCPQLEVLKVDLRYFSEKVTINDAEAFYDDLLKEDETPTWPSSLRQLSILHAAKWSPEAAQRLFRSLIDSASDLLDLRSLVIHAHINIPWRDRVGFRDQWIERLRRVYLRKSREPSMRLGSFRQFRMCKQVHNADELGQDYSDSDAPYLRRLSHVRISPHEASGDTEVYSDSDEPLATAERKPRRSMRVAETQTPLPSESATEASDSETEGSDPGHWRDQPEKFIQGQCHEVDISIDNQRPRENQFTEGDFLDSEVSGDEDWQEGADSGAEDSYAW